MITEHVTAQTFACISFAKHSGLIFQTNDFSRACSYEARKLSGSFRLCNCFYRNSREIRREVSFTFLQPRSKNHKWCRHVFSSHYLPTLLFYHLNCMFRFHLTIVCDYEKTKWEATFEYAVIRKCFLCKYWCIVPETFRIEPNIH